MKSIVLLCMLIGAGVIWSDNLEPSVYACSDKQKNPADVQAQCKRLTRGQWWAR